MKLTVSLAQMDVQLGEPEQNIARARGFVEEAARRGSDLVILPELWSTGYDLERADVHASETDTGVFAELAAWARQHEIAVFGSCLSLLARGAYGNTGVLFNRQGEALGDYSKVHLFRLMEEDRYLTAGDALTLVDAPWGKTGLAICYDLRFPEMFRRYAVHGAVMVLLPAEWPHPRLAHWRTLIQARAIENQLFMVACNRVGRSKATDFFGHSMVVDPWGEPVVEGGEGEMLLTVTIETDLVDQVRRKIPVFGDRRARLYEAPFSANVA